MTENEIIRTRYAIRIVGSHDPLVPYDLKYCRNGINLIKVHAELVRIDHIRSDFATTGVNWTSEYTVVQTVNAPADVTPLPDLWVETNVRKPAREYTPGTVVWLSSCGVNGNGWKRVVVRNWRGCGNGYASLFSTDGIPCGQFLADDLIECER